MKEEAIVALTVMYLALLLSQGRDGVVSSTGTLDE